MRKKPGIRIIWPQYLDSQRSSAMGRRLTKDVAITLPKAEEMLEAAQMLGYTAHINPKARYPKTWWDPPGNLLIDTMGQNKKKVMEKLVEKIVEIRKKREIEKAAQKGKKKKKKKR